MQYFKDVMTYGFHLVFLMWTHNFWLYWHQLVSYRANKKVALVNEVFRVRPCNPNLIVFIGNNKSLLICENIYLLISTFQYIEKEICSIICASLKKKNIVTQEVISVSNIQIVYHILILLLFYPTPLSAQIVSSPKFRL